MALLWDASALAKRYAPETGSDVVDALFERIGKTEMVATTTGYAETYSILLRRRNRHDISERGLNVAKSALRHEVLGSDRFYLLSIDDEAVFAGLAFMDSYNVNATDAALLAIYLRYASGPSGTGDAFLVASDRRLLRAATAEGLAVINPEDTDPDDVLALLTSQ